MFEELLKYWVVGMVISAALVAYVPWAKVKKEMGYGRFSCNFVNSVAVAVIPICSYGIWFGLQWPRPKQIEQANTIWR